MHYFLEYSTRSEQKKYHNLRPIKKHQVETSGLQQSPGRISQPLTDSRTLPEDSFALMIELYQDDFSDVECVLYLEKYFSVKFPEGFFREERNGDLKFKDVVRSRKEINLTICRKNCDLIFGTTARSIPSGM